MYATRATWYGYPTPAQMEYWTVEMDESHAHVVSEGVA